MPIAGLKSGDAARDCHILEAMGIKYEGSVYPAKHACNANNLLPQNGPDAVVYPNIEFSLSAAKVVGANKALVVGKPVEIAVNADWTMHGITQNKQSTIVVERLDAKRISVKSKMQLNIKDFGIVVKPFGPITVRDTATVELSLMFEQR